ncbi:MAG: 50S ribosomal protein L4 [Gemmatimonadales bacterium]|nr:50S ribosomal protein L4 [Gemmatimonadales bacterium]
MSDTMNFDAAAYTALGTPRERVALPGAVFDGTVNMPVMHQAVKAQLANRRQGTHATKTRRWVVGGNQKPWKQKGTGRARAGSTRSPIFRGGGTVFGPQPRGYEQKLPRQVKALARKSAFNARAREQAVLVIDRFEYEKPKTAMMAQLLARLDVGQQKVLILTDGAKPNVYLSARNIPNVVVQPYSDASTYDLIWSDVVLVEGPAIGHDLAPVAEKAVEKVKVKKASAKKSPAKAEKAAAKAEAKEAKKATAKKVARKSAAKTAAKKAAPKAAAKKAPAKKKAAPKAAAKKPAAKKAASKKKEK